jgi:hypothetical protein
LNNTHPRQGREEGIHVTVNVTTGSEPSPSATRLPTWAASAVVGLLVIGAAVGILLTNGLLVVSFP